MQKSQDIEAQMSHEQLLAELMMLRSENAALKQDNASLERQGEELRGQNDTLSKQIAVLSADNDALAAQNAEAAEDIAKLTEELREARAEIERLTERTRLAAAQQFTPSSEKADPNDISTFNDVEAQASKPARKGRKKSSKPKKEIDWSRYPQEVVDHFLDEPDMDCGACGARLEPIGYDVKWELKRVPAKLVAVQHRVWKYVCPACSDANARGEEVATTMVRAKGPSLPLGKSHASASLIAAVIHSKYRLANPLYRTWLELSNMGLPDTRQTLANWVIGVNERWLAQLYGLMWEVLLAGSLVHIDETPVTCLEESKKRMKRGSDASYMWLFCSGACDRPLYLYKFGPTREKKVMTSALSGWSGAIVTDAYVAYTGKLPDGMRRVACGVHLRRYFLNAAKAVPEGDKRWTAAREGVNRINAIFHAEHELEKEFGEDYDELLEGRRAKMGPMMGSFIMWVKRMREVYAPPKSTLRIALDYAWNNWADFCQILRDGRYPLSNNRAEQAIRPFAVGRKNWLFSDTTRGADASAAIYSIVITARANGLDDERYVEWLLTEMPKAADEGNLQERLADFLPWSDKVPESCRALVEDELFKDDPLVDVDPTIFDMD